MDIVVKSDIPAEALEVLISREVPIPPIVTKPDIPDWWCGQVDSCPGDFFRGAKF